MLTDNRKHSLNINITSRASHAFAWSGVASNVVVHCAS